MATVRTRQERLRGAFFGEPFVGSYFCYLTMWIGRIGGFILKRIVFISNESTASNTRLEVDLKVVTNYIKTYISRHLYLMRKLYHPHYGYLLFDRQAAPTECVKQSMLLQKYLLFPCCLISSAPWQDHIPRSHLSIQLPSSSTFIGIPFLFIVSLIISKGFAFARNLLRLFTLFLARPALYIP